MNPSAIFFTVISLVTTVSPKLCRNQTWHTDTLLVFTKLESVNNSKTWILIIWTANVTCVFRETDVLALHTEAPQTAAQHSYILCDSTGSNKEKVHSQLVPVWAPFHVLVLQNNHCTCPTTVLTHVCSCNPHGAQIHMVCHKWKLEVDISVTGISLPHLSQIPGEWEILKPQWPKGSSKTEI